MMYLDDQYETGTGLRVPRVGSEVTEPAGFTIDRPYGTDDFDFLCFTTPVQILVDGTRVTARAGTCIIYAPGTPHWYTGGTRSFTHDWFHFLGPEAERLIDACGVHTDELLYPHATAFVTDIVRAICLEMIQRQPCWDQAVSSHVADLLVRLTRSLAGEARSGRGTQRALVRHRVGDVRLALLGAPEERWTVEEMASRAYLSRARFSALYKEYFGTSPMEDVIGMRLQKACWLIENSSLSIKEIARRVGFDDAAYFNRLFRRRMGVTPGKHR